MNILATALMPHPPVMIPNVGNGQERAISKTLETAQKVAEAIAELQPETIVIISPHGPVFSDAITIRDTQHLSGNLREFGSPEIQFESDSDTEFINELLEQSKGAHIPVARFDHHLAERFQLNEHLDHGVIVPFHFIQKEYSQFQVVAINYGLLSEIALYKFGKCIRETAATLNRNIVVIASGDLSHALKDRGPYDYHPCGPEFDHNIMEALVSQDRLKAMTMDRKLIQHASECGKRSINIMLGAIDGYKANEVISSYEGPFGVGYGIVLYKDFKQDQAFQLQEAIEVALKEQHQLMKTKESPQVKLARETIELFVETGRKKIFNPKDLPECLQEKSSGVFVSIKDSGGLRGCIGTTSGFYGTLGEEIIANAIKACSEDSRFDPVETHELENLTLSVDVLSNPEAIDSEDELDPKVYGVIVKCGWRQGLLLPDLEGVQTIEDQLRIARNKGGIEEHEQVSLFRFTVERYE